MRVFLTRAVNPKIDITMTPSNSWTIRPNMPPHVAEIQNRFSEMYPGQLPTSVSPLDFTIIAKHNIHDMELWIVGKYWGDESKYEGAQILADMRNNNLGYQSLNIKSRALICQDNEHPTMLPWETICGPDDGTTVSSQLFSPLGYYLASDPDTFVPA